MNPLLLIPLACITAAILARLSFCRKGVLAAAAAAWGIFTFFAIRWSMHHPLMTAESISVSLLTAACICVLADGCAMAGFVLREKKKHFWPGFSTGFVIFILTTLLLWKAPEMFTKFTMWIAAICTMAVIFASGWLFGLMAENKRRKLIYILSITAIVTTIIAYGLYI